MRFRQLVPGILFGLTVTTLAFGASADAAGAKSFVEREQSTIQKLIEDKAPTSEVKKAIDGMVDYTEISQRALGKPCPPRTQSCTNHWDELNDTQKAEVTDLFKQLVEKKYRENAKKSLKYETTVKGTKEETPEVTKVRTSAKSKTDTREPPVLVDYVVRSTGNGHKVIDIITEGSIMSQNYYDQAHKMLTTPGQGYPYFTGKLREKIAKKTKGDNL